MDVLKAIYEALDEINLDLEDGEKIRKSEDSLIFSPGSSLDSLGLVNLITILEQKIEEDTDMFVSIADERAMSMQTSPFRSVKTLKEYIESLIDDN